MNHSKETIDVVKAAMALAERDVDLGLVSLDQIRSIPRTRFAPVERKHAVALLKAEGKSNRQIATTLDVGLGTVNRDVSELNGSESEPNGSPENEPSDPVDRKPRRAAPEHIETEIEPLSEIESEIDEEHLKTGFMIRADVAARSAVYSGPVDEEVCRAVTRTAMAWQNLAQQLGGK